ncbi:MAG: uncharacterized protein QOE56_448 [Solirubrobacterales bacterium]|jgi:hypothetical protein|nr:uncharacterized protein [Solirubrobacterales bacterium]
MENATERKFAVITGASSGIGFELAKVFAENRFDLLIAAEDEELSRAAGELGQIAPSVETVKVDLAKPEGVGLRGPDGGEGKGRRRFLQEQSPDRRRQGHPRFGQGRDASQNG